MDHALTMIAPMSQLHRRSFLGEIKSSVVKKSDGLLSKQGIHYMQNYFYLHDSHGAATLPCSFAFSSAECSRPCENGGKCIGRESCMCPEGYAGKYCHVGQLRTPLEYTTLN